MTSAPAYACLFFGILLAAALSDLRDLRIPNRLTAAMAASGPVAIGLLGPGWGHVPAALAVGGLALAIGWALFQFGWLGGGDAKLAAAAAIWLGAEASVVFVLAMAIFGAVLAAALLTLSRWGAARSLVGQRWQARLGTVPIPVPYALAIAPAGAVALSIRLAGLN